VEVEGVEPALEKPRVLRAEGRIILYYSEFSLLEAIAKAVKLNVPRSAVEHGVTAITAGYRKCRAQSRGVAPCSRASPGGPPGPHRCAARSTL